jgi:hypothetical protein
MEDLRPLKLPDGIPELEKLKPEFIQDTRIIPFYE